jgi:branched-chain amino acid transport system permease protein
MTVNEPLKGGTMMKLRFKIPGAVWGMIASCLLLVLCVNRSEYFTTLFIFSGIYVIAISGLDVLFGYSGQISLGHATFYAAGAYTSSLLAVRLGVPVWLGILIGCVVSALLGVVIAIPASKLVHQFLALLTIAAGQMSYVFLSKAKSITGAMAGVKRIPELKLFGFAFKSNLSYAILVLILCFIFLFIKQRIVNSSTGRAFMAIRENVVAANGIGINVRKYKIIAFIISAVYMAFAGSLYAHYVNYISPETFTSNQSILFLTMLLFGGMGNLAGPIIGAVVITVLNEALQGFSNYRTLVYGIVIMIAVLFMPKGLYGLLTDLGDRTKRKLVKKDADN